MTKAEALKLAEQVSLSDLKQMLETARQSITDWRRVSRVNKLITIGKTFNTFTNCELDKMPHVLAVTNMIWEFGEYLPNYQKEVAQKAVVAPQEPYHEEPKPYGKAIEFELPSFETKLATLETVITFGRYKGKTVSKVLQEDAQYILWADEKVTGFKLEPELRNTLSILKLFAKNKWRYDSTDPEDAYPDYEDIRGN